MSDRRHDGPKATRSRVPVWALVASVIGVAILAGSAAWLLAGPRTPVPAPVTTSTITPTPTVEATVPVVPTSTVPATATPKPATVREPALIKRITGGPSEGYRITLDYIQILHGKAAADAATAAGDESPPPNDYYIVNTSKTLRTFSLPKSAYITVREWPGADVTAKHRLTVARFADIMPGGANTKSQWANARYDLTVKAGTTITRIEQIFFP